MTENTLHLALHYTHTHARTHEHTHAHTRTEDKVQHSRSRLWHSLSPDELSSWSLRESRPCFIRHWSSSCFAFPVASLTSIRSVETELRNQLPRTTSVLPGALGVLQYFSLTLNTVYKDVPNEILSVTSTITATLMKAKHLACSNLYWPWHQTPATSVGKCQALKCHKVLAACVLT